jgi:hypothetical protein
MTVMPIINSVAIIGGGPSGAVTLDALVREGVFSNITLFERKEEFGGTWRTDPSQDGRGVKPGSLPSDLDPISDIPEVVKKLKSGEIVKVDGSAQDKWFGSPALYDLRTNVPERIMTFSDLKQFPYLTEPGVHELTTRDSVEKYVIDYINRYKDVEGVHFKKNSNVEKIEKTEQGKYRIFSRVNHGDAVTWAVDEFDSIIIATGHYNVPKIPYVEGIDKVLEKYPHSVIHSKGFVPDASFTKKRIVVIGSRSSSVDTVNQLKKYTPDIYWSVRIVQSDFNAHNFNKPTGTPRKPVISKYSLNGDGIVVEFEDGSTLEGIDYIIYATGYHFSFPFLNDLFEDLTHEGIFIKRLYQHTFLIDEPLISFVGIPIDGMSFRVFEYQAILAARYLAGKTQLPPVEEQEAWYRERLERVGKNRNFHSTINDPALVYIDNLVKLGGGHGAIGDKGKVFPKFSDEDLEVYEDNKAKLVKRWSEL